MAAAASAVQSKPSVVPPQDKLSKTPKTVLALIAAFAGPDAQFAATNKLCYQACKLPIASPWNQLWDRIGLALQGPFKVIIPIEELQAYRQAQWELVHKAASANQQQVQSEALNLNSERFAALNHFASELALQRHTEANIDGVVSLRCLLADRTIHEYSEMTKIFSQIVTTAWISPDNIPHFVRDYAETEQFVFLLLQENTAHKGRIRRIDKQTNEIRDINIGPDFFFYNIYSEYPMIVPFLSADGGLLLFNLKSGMSPTPKSTLARYFNFEKGTITNVPLLPEQLLKIASNQECWVDFVDVKYDRQYIVAALRFSTKNKDNTLFKAHFALRIDRRAQEPKPIFIFASKKKHYDEITGISIQNRNICISTLEGVYHYNFQTGKITDLNAKRVKMFQPCPDNCNKTPISVVSAGTLCPQFRNSRLNMTPSLVTWLAAAQTEHLSPKIVTFADLLANVQTKMNPVFHAFHWDTNADKFVRKKAIDPSVQVLSIDALHCGDILQLKTHNGTYFTPLRNNGKKAFLFEYYPGAEVKAAAAAGAEAETKARAEDNSCTRITQLRGVQILKWKFLTDQILAFTNKGILSWELN